MLVFIFLDFKLLHEIIQSAWKSFILQCIRMYEKVDVEDFLFYFELLFGFFIFLRGFFLIADLCIYEFIMRELCFPSLKNLQINIFL